MAAFVQVRNINPIGAVDTVIDGEAVTVPAGEVVKVSPEAAGKAPEWVAVKPGEPHDPTRQYDEDGLKVLDLGSGLLAQNTNWEAVKAAPATKEA